jgi:hypothetical protein
MTAATTTVALAPKPVRKRRTRAKSATTKTMKEQTKVTPIKDTIVPVVVNEYPLTKPNVELLTNEVLLQDLKNRIAIHNYEIQEAWRDYNWLVDNHVKPLANKVINKVKDMTS